MSRSALARCDAPGRSSLSKVFEPVHEIIVRYDRVRYDYLDMTFINRSDELAFLERRWNSPRGEFLVFYGRRRVGKSHLLAYFADQSDRKSLVFEAVSGSSDDNLADISREIAAFTGRADHAAQGFTSWQAVFAAFEEIARVEKVFFVLDEFQFIAREEPAIGSLMNRMVESNADNPNFKLAISGSDVSFFASEIMGYSGVTYGRRTGSIDLQPFRFEHVKEFVPGYSIEDQIRTYAVFGGMPFYLEGVASAGSLEQAIFAEVLSSGAKLAEEPDFLLAQESKIREADIYKTVLRAIATGVTKARDIAQRIKREPQVTYHYLSALEEIGLIQKRFPVTQLSAGKDFFWEVKDPFLRFWFRFVGRYESRLMTDARATRHLEETVLPNLDEFVSTPGFELVCQEWVSENFSEVSSVGTWWGSRKEQRQGRRRNHRYEADVVGVGAEGEVLLLGSCKWTKELHPVAELNKLRVIRDEMLQAPDAKLLFFSKNGVDQSIRDEANRDSSIRIVELNEI